VESPVLHIRLLGEVDLRRGDVPLPALESARAESLLAYLLIHRGAPQPRQRLAFLLWPDSTEAQARTNLRKVLHNLRRALPDADRFLDVTPRTLQWRPDALYQLDVADFETALAGAGDDTARLAAAVDAYTGDLVEGSYDEWLIEERERLSTLHLHALERLTTLLEERGVHDAALRYAERLLQRDPLREATCRQLMRLHDARGDRARALRLYHACSGALERELGVEPSAATRAVYEALLPAADEAVATAERPAALIGRAAERAQLTELWRASERGRAQLALVSGEPGIGKTRLVEELRAWCAHRGVVTAQARSYAAEGDLAYGPVAAWLRSDRLAARRGRLDPGRRAELARVLPELASHPQPPSDSEQRQRLFDALAHALHAAPAEPLLLVADDLQWADDETLQFLHYLVRAAPDAPLLVLATARREDMDDRAALTDLLRGLRALDRATEIELEPLSRAETGVLAERVAGRALDEPEAGRLYAETEGNPLFVVETLRAGGASPRVQAVLEARLAQLSAPAQELAQLAATIGRAFTSQLLAAASGADADALVRDLDELWRRRIVREQGADAYDFSHDKLREAAYAALSPARRRQLHLRVARALEREDAATQIAAHYDRAGAAREAAPWYARAAAEAQRMYANGEAIRLLERGLALLAQLPPSAERDEQELALLVALLVPLAAVQGAVAPRLIEAQRRVLALEGEPTSPLLRSVALTELTQGHFEEARSAGRELHARGERDGDAATLVEGHYVLGIAAFWQGEFQAAREQFVAAVERSRPDHRATHLERYGLDPKVICQSRLANALWFLGEREAAVAARDGALALAEEIGHPASIATALVFAALLAIELGDTDGLRDYASALRAREPEQHARAAVVAVASYEGHLAVLGGDHAAGLARIRRALDDARAAAHAPGSYACTARVLVEACAVVGDPRAGLATVDEVLAGVGGARLWDAELRRRRAEFLAALGTPADEVERELAHALRIATDQGALALAERVRGTLAERGVVQGPAP
jgi:DNA-binding SARP family transcriptional activator